MEKGYVIKLALSSAMVGFGAGVVTLILLTIVNFIIISL